MGKTRRGLGRGLDSLMPPGPTGVVREIGLDEIVPNGNQPRKRFDERRLAELADSIREHGVLQPLLVSGPDTETKYRLIVGERRWQAARLAGLASVPAIVREATDSSTLELALVENLQRQDLDVLEEAAAYDRLLRVSGLTQQEIAQRVGRSRSSIANALRLLHLPAPVADMLLAGEISEGHARALLGLTDPLSQEVALRRIRAEGLNVRQTEQLVRQMSEPRSPRRPRLRQQPPELRAVEDRLRTVLATKVTVRRGPRHGRIVIEFYSDDDLQSLYERLTR